MKMDKLSMQYFLGLASFFKARHLFWLSAVARPAKGGIGAAAAIQQPLGNRTSIRQLAPKFIDN